MGKFILCRASAGSGKTFTLVKNFISLAFDVRDESELTTRFSRILAITFTNKAANEMKERIMKELKAMQRIDGGNKMAEMIGEERRIDKATLERYAGIVHHAILHNYSDLSVQTIDSFMSRLVRTFSYDLGLPLNFNLTLEQDEIIRPVVAELLSQIGVDNDLTDLLENMMVGKMEDGKSHNIERDITEQCQELFNEQTPQHIKELNNLTFADAKKLANEIRRLNKKDEEAVRPKGKALKDEFDAISSNPKDYYQGARGVYQFVANVADDKKSLPGIKINSYVEQNYNGSKNIASDKADEATQGRLNMKTNALKELVYLLRVAQLRINSREAIRKQLFTVALLQRLNEIAEQYYSENEILHLSKFNHEVADVVSDNPAPFIYERVGSRYLNYLIDEFQDTSRLQWHNLLPLVSDSIDSSNDSLIVGDAKQAIYRFRDGDAHQFAKLPDVDSTTHGKNFNNYLHDTTLDTNFRTRRAVVEFNNRFFEWAVRNCYGEHTDMNEMYIGSGTTPTLRQKYNKEGGYVNVAFTNKDDKEATLKGILNAIKQQTTEKLYDYSDIMVLARGNKKLAEIGQYLAQNNIPVISAESFLLSNSTAVKCLLSLLQYIANPADRVAAIYVIGSLQKLGKLPYIDSDVIGTSGSIKLEEILADHGVSISRQRLKNMSLYDCCEEAVRQLGIADAEHGYIATFFDKVANYTQHHRNDIGEFLEWYDEFGEKFSTRSDASLNAVRLMTVHKSKGLEAPIVIYPVEPPKSHGVQQWVTLDEETLAALGINQKDDKGHAILTTCKVNLSKDKTTMFDDAYNAEKNERDLDDMNVLYVALTRPKDKLFLFVDYAKIDKKKPPQDAPKMLQVFPDHYENYMSDGSEWFTLTNNGAEGYTIGSDDLKESHGQNDSTDNTITLQQISYPGWTEKVRIAPESAKIFGGTAGDDRKAYGNKVHAILANIRHAGQAEQATRTYCDKAAEQGEKEDFDALLHAVKSVVENPQCKSFFANDATVKAECDIMNHGKLQRPDRVVITPAKTYVVDFKTGRSKNIEVLAAHRTQVATYCKAIKEMGYPDVEGYLVYINDDGAEVEKVLYEL